MSNQQSGRRVFWISWLFGIVFIVAIYLILVKIEENDYNNFIRNEWSTRTIKYTQENSPLRGEYMTNLTTDDKGRIWIGTDTTINVVTPDDQWATFLIDNKGGHVNSLAIDKLERTWVGTFEGLYVLDGDGQWLKYDEPSKTVYEHYTSSDILIDSSDRIWVANNDGLRMFLPDGTKQFYTKENSGLPDDYITALAEDRQSNIWIGTRTKGVVVFDQNGQWRNYQENGSKNGLVENWVTTILIDDQDRVWIGTMRRGLSMLSPDGNWTTYDVPQWGRLSNPEFYDDEINSLAMDKQGRLWIGTWDGLFVLDSNGNWLAYTHVNSGLDPDYIKALTVDDSGRLWMATFHEVIVLDLRNELPKPVPADRLRLRTTLLTPMRIATAIGNLIALILMPVTIPILGILYIILLITLPLSTVGLVRSDKMNDKKLFYNSVVIFVISVLGVPLLWIFSLFLRIALRD
jgi:ligand-binding sensor domain-containing protein